METYEYKIASAELHGPDNDNEIPDEDYRLCPVCGHRSDIWEVLSTLTTMVGELKRKQYDDYLGCAAEPYIVQPFDEDDLIDAIECYATAVAYSDQLLVWVPMDKLNDFLHPLLDDVLERDEVRVTLDSTTAMIDLTEICDFYALDMGAVYEDCEI